MLDARARDITMKDWNVLVTVRPGPQRTRALLNALQPYGEFHRTHFQDVCIGRVADVTTFLECVRTASDTAANCVRHLGRVIPVERSFLFTPATLVESPVW